MVIPMAAGSLVGSALPTSNVREEFALNRDSVMMSKNGVESSPFALRVCFDGRKILHGGIGVYIQNAISGLLAHGVRLTVLINDSPNSLKGVLSPAVYEACRFVQISAKPFSREELFGLRSEVDWSQCDLFHTPNYVLPFGVPIPSVITVHDLIHLRFPEQKYYPYIAGPLLLSSLFRSKRVVAVSRATCLELCSFARRFPWGRRHKVRVVSNALSPSLIQRAGQPKAIQPDYVKTRFGVRSRYLLAVLSTVKPHKGVKDLLDAFLDLESRGVLRELGDVRLLLVGQGTQNLLQIEKLIAQVAELRCAHLLGEVTREELFQLYGNADGVVIPSFQEGFCLPVIEAQSVGTPVLCRPLPSVLDNLSPRDWVCKDFSHGALLRGIEEFLRRSKTREIPAEAIQEWQNEFARRFDPVLLGRQLLEVYSEVASPKSPTDLHFNHPFSDSLRKRAA
ncbi:MAG: glycosyltransferase family 4 protein [Bdellovibrionales bacterium]|nr:glycosyltransferase family 4 protein [Bdellovibrionales bacterium]